MPKYLLGIDNGCTMSKAALFTIDGREIAVESRKTETLTPKPGFLERDIEEMWQSTAEVIRAVLESSGVSPGEVACVASAGHGNGLYLVEGNGAPVRDAILSTDSRAREITDRWEAEGIDKLVRPKTMQGVWPAQPNALLLWLKQNEPESTERAKWVFMAKDYVRFRLTGEAAAEISDMSGTSLLSVRDGEYDTELLEAFGIADLQRLLPPLVQSAEVCGQVTPQAAAVTGLKEGTPVAGGVFDIDACALASGVIDESQLCMVAGTWGCNQYVSETPVIDDVFMTSRFCLPGHYLVLEGSPTSASNLEWFVTEFLSAEKEKAEAADGSVYDLCNELVAGTTPDESSLVFLPFLYGSHASPDAKGSLLGLTGWHTRAHVLRALYEGVVFGHKHHVDLLLRFRAAPAAIRLTGGATHSEVWTQLFADCFQTPIEVPDGDELGALGAAICAGVACGAHPGYTEAIDAMVHFSRRVEPETSKAEVYETKYRRYQRAIEALDPVWGELG